MAMTHTRRALIVGIIGVAGYATYVAHYGAQVRHDRQQALAKLAAFQNAPRASVFKEEKIEGKTYYVRCDTPGLCYGASSPDDLTDDVLHPKGRKKGGGISTIDISMVEEALRQANKLTPPK